MGNSLNKNRQNRIINNTNMQNKNTQLTIKNFIEIKMLDEINENI